MDLSMDFRIVVGRGWVPSNGTITQLPEPDTEPDFIPYPAWMERDNYNDHLPDES